MALTREQLIEMAVGKFFTGGNNNDAEGMCSPLSDDCVMRFTSAKYVYEDYKSILIHLQEFTSTFKTINFHNFVCIADVDAQSIAVRFQIHLEDYEGEKTMMSNCNFFQANDDGLFNDVLIYNSAPLQKGFEAGSAV